jgi:hypothetical protein
MRLHTPHRRLNGGHHWPPHHFPCWMWTLLSLHSWLRTFQNRCSHDHFPGLSRRINFPVPGHCRWNYLNYVSYRAEEKHCFHICGSRLTGGVYRWSCSWGCFCRDDWVEMCLLSYCDCECNAFSFCDLRIAC